MQNDNADKTVENRTPSVSPGTYSRVTVILHETVGAVFLGILAAIFAFAWMKSKSRRGSSKLELEA